MASIAKKSFDTPDESRRPDKTTVDVVRLGGDVAARLTLEPGWKWSECVQPVAGTASCQSRHLGVVAAGQMHIQAEDGTEEEIAAGDVYVIEPGHNAWVIGDAAFVGYEFETKTAQEYAAGA